MHFVPRGVIGIIAPWTFPFSIPIGETIMSVIAGNAVVLKPSEVTPLIALKARALFIAADLSSDLFQVVTGRDPAGAALIDGGINYCVFTGSVATGKKVAAACGERLIGCADVSRWSITFTVVSRRASDHVGRAGVLKVLGAVPPSSVIGSKLEHFLGAGYQIRTGDLQLGKLTLYR